MPATMTPRTCRTDEQTTNFIDKEKSRKPGGENEAGIICYDETTKKQMKRVEETWLLGWNSNSYFCCCCRWDCRKKQNDSFVWRLSVNTEFFPLLSSISHRWRFTYMNETVPLIRTEQSGVNSRIKRHGNLASIISSAQHIIWCNGRACGASHDTW